MFQFTSMIECAQIRFTLTAEATGLMDNVELSIEYHEENLHIVEVWVRVLGDNVKGLIRQFEAKNKNMKSESFHQNLITQVNEMPDINDYIDAWIWHRMKGHGDGA